MTQTRYLRLFAQNDIANDVIEYQPKAAFYYKVRKTIQNFKMGFSKNLYCDSHDHFHLVVC